MAAPLDPQVSLIRNGDFVRLWLIGFLLFGVRWIETLAAAVFTYSQTGSVFLVAMLSMLRMLPMALFGILFGAFANAVVRRKAMLFVTLGMFVISSVLTVLSLTDEIEVWHLALCAFLNGTSWATDNAVRRMMMGDAVGAERMVRAMASDTGAINLSRVIGPTAAGIAMAWGGVTAAFGLGAALHFLAIMAAFGIGQDNKTKSSHVVRLLKDAIECLRAVKNDPELRAIFAGTAIFNIFGWPFTSLIPVIAQNDMRLDATGIGFFASLDGFGAICGAILIAIFAVARRFSQVYFGGIAFYFVAMIAFAFCSEPLSAGAALVAIGIGGAGFSVMQATLVYRSVQSELRTRMLGALSFCIGLAPIGFLQCGYLAERYGSSTAIIVSALEGLAAVWLSAPKPRADV